MPINRPDRSELIASVREMLEEQFLPNLDDKNLIYQSRVSINILKIVERELERGDAMIDAEQERLASLLGEDGDVDSLNASLIERIRAGRYDDAPQALMEHFLSTTLDKIAIDNPRYATYCEYLENGRFSNY
ncbi:hypothetical protein FV139_19735 [Parahaliea maris]|uniref:DUF6285 domain-containing protein n=1 Tax=Parahaliea maris TaxID=2716870 RepID=A0A5C8ZM17_9GAMM|nr:DUF6285 domain-containing protein [Parahaliea maris]TXS89523.1 hypothetical protein FV139_19735 [Parahaliea maris]